MEKFLKKYSGAIIVVLLLGLFVLLSVLTEEGRKKNSKDEIDLSKLTEEVKGWVNATESDKYVVTVLAQTTCRHCISFKPIITALKETYGFELYWFEVDAIYNENRTEDYKAVTEYYGLKNYNGTPHTYITKAGELLVEQGGSMDSDTTKNFLKSYSVIVED